MTHALQRFSLSKYSHKSLPALALSGLFLIACSTGDENRPAPLQRMDEPLEVEVLELQYRPWRQQIQAYGRIVSAEKVVIGVDLAGTVTAVLFREGQSIEAGQQLVRLDDRKQLLRLARASANVATANAELAKTRSTFERYRELIGRQVISEEAYRQTEAAFNSAIARRDQASAAEKLAQQELRDLTLISPVKGVVETEAVEPGQKVRPGDRLLVIQTTDSLQVVSYVREQEINLLHAGDEAPVTSPGVPGRIYQARIESVGNAADARTGNFPVKLRIENQDGLLREGMSAAIEFKGQQAESVLAIPRSAITDRDRRRVVFIVRDGQAHQVEPSLGMGMGDWVPVLSGLEAGDRIILTKLPMLADRKPIKFNQTVITEGHKAASL